MIAMWRPHTGQIEHRLAGRAHRLVNDKSSEALRSLIHMIKYYQQLCAPGSEAHPQSPKPYRRSRR